MGLHFRLFKNIDIPLAILPFLFMAASLVMMTSISQEAINSRLFIVQAAAYMIGFTLLIFLLFVDYRFLARVNIWILYAIAMAFQLLVYTPIGVSLNGARAWINVGITYFQPSEVFKIFFALLLASFLTKNAKNLTSFKGFAIIFAFAAPMIGVVAIEDFGSAIVMVVMFIAMVFAAGLNWKLFLRLAIATVVMVPIAYQFLAPHQKERFEAFLHPDNTNIEATYHVFQSKISMGSGGFFGKGIGNGTQKELNFLPVKESDFIYSVVVEETGFVGGMAIILLFLILAWRGISIALKSLDNFGRVLAIGLTAMLIFQAMENMGMTMGVMPVTGITLPFISAGGSGILSNMITVGLLLSISMRSKEINFS